ncbi:MAG: sulfite oxidase heme-binding subunit YedZ [Betaproteobacteria bacterium]
MRLNDFLSQPICKRGAFALLCLPFLQLVVLAATEGLGPNPQEALIRSTGDWALRMICLTLMVTPMRVELSLSSLGRWRRMLGLFAFSYAAVHMLCYAVFDRELDAAAIVADIVKRPFILMGMLTLVLLLPLALTSFNAAIRRLGAARWQALHRLVYAASVTMLLHFLWMRAGKSDFAEVWAYTAVVTALLGWRVRRWLQSRRSPRI